MKTKLTLTKREIRYLMGCLATSHNLITKEIAATESSVVKELFYAIKQQNETTFYKLKHSIGGWNAN